jgi:hypothetical protein
MDNKIIYAALLGMTLMGTPTVYALSPTDKFIVNHGVSACNGEGPNCQAFMDIAYQINNEPSDLPSITFE